MIQNTSNSEKAVEAFKMQPRKDQHDMQSAIPFIPSSRLISQAVAQTIFVVFTPSSTPWPATNLVRYVLKLIDTQMPWNWNLVQKVNELLMNRQSSVMRLLVDSSNRRNDGIFEVR